MRAVVEYRWTVVDCWTVESWTDERKRLRDWGILSEDLEFRDFNLGIFSVLNVNGKIRNVKRRLHSASSLNLQLSICHFCLVKANRRLTPVINIAFLSPAGKLVESAVKSRF
jgi:hypothetical protein